MMDLPDHAAGRGRVRQSGLASDAVELEADQRLALLVLTPDRAADLLERDGLGGHGDDPSSSRSSVSRSVRLAALTATRLQRRNLDVAPGRDRTRRILMFERVERR